MTSNGRRGQSLIEFCLLLPIWSTALSLVLLTAIKSLLPFLLTLDLWDLARAHLYGAHEDCRASSFWPQSLIEVQVSCPKIPDTYLAKSFLIWSDARIPLAEVRYGLWSAL